MCDMRLKWLLNKCVWYYDKMKLNIWVWGEVIMKMNICVRINTQCTKVNNITVNIIHDV